MNFIEKINNSWSKNESLLCVGLDPDLAAMPVSISGAGGAIFAFCRQIVDATADIVCAFKPQVAYFSAVGAEQQLVQIIDYIHNAYPDIPVILDAKRGDVGSTAKQYAIEAFERYQADAVTINPYLGWDTIEPFAAYEDKGLFLLCRTSNASSAELQEIKTESGQMVYEAVAYQAEQRWAAKSHHQLGLVVGATWVNSLSRVRQIVPSMPLLVPGIGKQGGDIDAVVKAGCTPDGNGLIINCSRTILYASDGNDFAEAAREKAIELRQLIQSSRLSR